MFKKGCKPWNKGKKLSKSHRRGIKKALKGRKFSKKWKDKLSEKAKGKKKSKKHKKKLSETWKGQRIGKKNPNWKGGITPLINKIRGLIKYKQWRSDVFQRDRWICQTCNKKSKGDLEAHHIKRLTKIIRDNKIKTVQSALTCKELWDKNNETTLCQDCHKLTRNYRNKN